MWIPGIRSSRTIQSVGKVWSRGGCVGCVSPMFTYILKISLSLRITSQIHDLIALSIRISLIWVKRCLNCHWMKCVMWFLIETASRKI